METDPKSDHTKLTFNYMRINRKLETLLDFLVRKFRYYDADEWTESIIAGRLLVDDKEVEPDRILESQQVVTYLRPDTLEPEVDRNFEVVYEDDYLIGVNKSGDLPTSPSGKYFKNTLVHVVREHFNFENLYTLHRLDRETSGILLFAKERSVAQKIAAQFRDKQVSKEYVGIIERSLTTKHVYVSAPIGRDVQSSIRIKQTVTPLGKPSQTHFYEQESIGNYAKVLVKPMTGRTHQIRVHCAYLGAPIVGDKLYGLPNDGFVDWIQRGEVFLREVGFPKHRQLLHASKLILKHPVTEKELVIRAEDRLLDELQNS